MSYDGTVISASEGGDHTVTTLVEKADERRKKLIWEEALYEATLQKGRLIISWKPLHTVNPLLFKFEEQFSQTLTQLRLIGVELIELPSDFGNHLKSVEVFSLENNHLTSIPDSITEMINLTDFNVSFNRISCLPHRIGFLYKVTSFPLNNNKLEELPMTFGALTSLKRLDLECNRLKILPENLDNLLSCQVLNVNRNRLIRLSRCLSHMPSLTSLSACWNQLSYIPLELFASTTITHLRLGTNMIKTISERIGEMTQLVELILDYNHISKLPLSMWKLKNLKYLRMEGNDELVDPPTDIVIQGASKVVSYFTDIFHSDKQARMRHIIYKTQNLLQQISDRKVYDPSLFEPDVKVDEKSEDYWYALQLGHFWLELLPKMQSVWKYLHSQGIIIPDAITEFEYNEKEVLWAFTNFHDAYGPVLLHQKSVFRVCACKDPHTGLPTPCIPPRQGYMCNRLCYLMKKNIIRQKDKDDRVWQAYKSGSLADAEKRSEIEANNYLSSNAGKRWLDDTAYEQAEEMMLEGGAGKVVEKRILAAEKKKQKIIKKFNKKIMKVQRVRDEKMKGIQGELNQLKENRKLAREGYLRDGIEFKINDLTQKLAQMPEQVELDHLHDQCAQECERIDDALYGSSSSENDEDIHHTSDDDPNAYSEDDSSDEAKRWRKRKERREKKLKQQRSLDYVRKKYGNDEDLNKGKKKKNSVLTVVNKVVDHYVMEPVIRPTTQKISKNWKVINYRSHKMFRNIKEISKIRVRKVFLKIIGNFDEVQKELKYEIKRQYIEHQIAIARDKARKEFQVIEQSKWVRFLFTFLIFDFFFFLVRQRFQGVSKEKSFIAWKKWVWTKQKRVERDMRRQYKTAIKWVSFVFLCSSYLILFVFSIIQRWKV
jgi:hypothetical protein